MCYISYYYPIFNDKLQMKGQVGAMKKTNLLILSLLFYTLTGFGISLTILGNVGVSSFNSLNLSVAHLTSLKVGTVTTMINGLFLLTYIILTQGKLIRSYVIQAISVICLGQVINFFTYQVFGSITVDHYIARLGLFMLGSIIAGFGTGMVLNLKILAFPIESVCHFLATRLNTSFAKLRYGVDIFSVTTSLVITFVTHGPLFIREGTVISLVLLSSTISVTKSVYEKWHTARDIETQTQESLTQI